jgi:hypothetical protein
MRRILTVFGVALLTTSSALAAEPPFQLSGLQMSLAGGSATLDTFGKYAGVSVLQLTLKTPDGKSFAPVFLEEVGDPDDYNKTDEAFRYERIPGQRTRFKIVFKTKAVAARLGGYRGPLIIEVQEVMAIKEDGKWAKGKELTNAVVARFEVAK